MIEIKIDTFYRMFWFEINIFQWKIVPLKKNVSQVQLLSFFSCQLKQFKVIVRMKAIVQNKNGLIF